MANCWQFVAVRRYIKHSFTAPQENRLQTQQRQRRRPFITAATLNPIRVLLLHKQRQQQQQHQQQQQQQQRPVEGTARVCVCATVERHTQTAATAAAAAGADSNYLLS